MANRNDAWWRRALATRFFFLWLVIVNNVAVSTWVYYKISSKTKKIAPALLYPAGAYVILSTSHAFWNFITRFMIPAKKDVCAGIDVVDEYIIVFARIALFLFFTYRLELTFEQSQSYKMNPTHMNILRVAFPVVFFALNAAWIPGKMKVVDIDGYGVYCSNTAREPALVYSAYAVDFVVNSTLLYLFVSKLMSITKLDASHNSRKLESTARNNTIFTGVSMVSTWLLFMSSVIQGWPIPEMRWFWVLDWSINVWCLLFTFRFIKWDQNPCFKAIFGSAAARVSWLKPDPDFDTQSERDSMADEKSDRENNDETTVSPATSMDDIDSRVQFKVERDSEE